ncbi:MAG TPA: bifunctional UDP-N-acetylglucosamine diphosphorylase/glucosamine-1-phosphate N-acetyltransferase GlmU [Stellaceae bacterium]|nr:bifunctional UDP-N-acetylglucosamine diphosphorylase/glucosamine-1-phosphate N-acetyltransferase GlmU [Stellaceae bacterium]
MNNTRFAVLILAAGQGTRMKSALPKVLHRIANRPMIQHVLAAAAPLKPARTIVVVAPGMDAVVQAVAPAETVVQMVARGTGHAVMSARPALADFAGDVLIMAGDAPLVTTETLSALLAERRRAPAAAAVVAGMRPADCSPYGRLVLASDGTLEAIVESHECTPAQSAISLCNAGVWAIDGRHLFPLLDGIDAENSKGEYYLTDIVAVARALGLTCRVVEAPADDAVGVNSRAELAIAERLMQRRLRAAAMAEGVTLIDPDSVFFSADTRIGRDSVVGPFVVFGPGVTIGEGVEIPAFCHMTGATVGDRASVGPFARLRPGAELAENVHIGNFVEVKNSRLAAGVKANHLTYLGDSTVGAGVNIGAGTITCNYDGFEKFRTEIGEGAFIGTNTSLVAPVTIGAGAIIAAGSVVTADVPADAMAIGRGAQVVKAKRAAEWRARRRAEKAAKQLKGKT